MDAKLGEGGDNYRKKLMKRKILYYPTISIPDNKWIRQAVLYWDEVSSVVPYSEDYRILESLKDTDRGALLDRGIYTPMRPDVLIENFDSDFREQMNEEIIEAINHSSFRSVQRHENQIIQRQTTNIHINKVKASYSNIHEDKITSRLFQLLEEKGLARYNPESHWIEFERTTANLYMSVLARYLAGVDENDTTIGTNRPAYNGLNFIKSKNENYKSLIDLNLGNLFPSPKKDVSIETILKFKDKRSDELKRFQLLVSEFQLNLVKSETKEELLYHSMSFERAIQGGVKDLMDTLNDERISFSLDTLKTFVNPDSPTLLATIGSIVNFHAGFINVPIDLTVLGISAIAAIQIGSKAVNQRNFERREARNSPVAYLYYAERNGIVPKI